MTPAILITRPDPGGTEFEHALRAVGIGPVEFMHSPLMQIVPVKTALDLTGFECLIFTSRAGVAQFGALSDRRDFRVYAVGDATARAADEIGMHAISCQGDASDLIERILADEEPGPCLHLRGRHARGDITQTLGKAGVPTQEQVIYEQVDRDLTPEAIRALKREEPVIVPLFSPRTARQFVLSRRGTAPIWVVAMSAAVADETAEICPQRVEIADSPDMVSMVRAVKRLIDAANRLEG